MVAMYVDGQKVGTLADAEALIPDLITRRRRIEFRDEAGNTVGTLHPSPPPAPGEPLVPWDPTITQEDIDRIKAEPFFTFDEVKKRMGWE